MRRLEQGQNLVFAGEILRFESLAVDDEFMGRFGDPVGEEVALVIIDPREMPRNWTEIWAAENIGECFPRTGSGAGPGDQAETEETAEEEPESQTHATQTAAAAREVEERPAAHTVADAAARRVWLERGLEV